MPRRRQGDRGAGPAPRDRTGAPRSRRSRAPPRRAPSARRARETARSIRERGRRGPAGPCRARRRSPDKEPVARRESTSPAPRLARAQAARARAEGARRPVARAHGRGADSTRSPAPAKASAPRNAAASPRPTANASAPTRTRARPMPERRARTRPRTRSSGPAGRSARRPARSGAPPAARRRTGARLCGATGSQSSLDPDRPSAVRKTGRLDRQGPARADDAGKWLLAGQAPVQELHARRRPPHLERSGRAQLRDPGRSVAPPGVHVAARGRRARSSVPGGRVGDGLSRGREESVALHRDAAALEGPGDLRVARRTPRPRREVLRGARNGSAELLGRRGRRPVPERTPARPSRRATASAAQRRRRERPRSAAALHRAVPRVSAGRAGPLPARAPPRSPPGSRRRRGASRPCPDRSSGPARAAGAPPPVPSATTTMPAWIE